jgi:bifunctional DNA-binding transcriptional regulator/antitoxin component of YhaV-PrlF toxin-antitoxin module
VDERGRVTGPAEILEPLGLNPRTEIEVRVRGAHVILSRAGEDHGADDWGRAPDDSVIATALLAGVDMQGLRTALDEGFNELSAAYIDGVRRGLAAHPEVTARLERVLDLAAQTFKNADIARAWLLRGHPLLQGRSPLGVAISEDGSRDVERILFNTTQGLPV